MASHVRQLVKRQLIKPGHNMPSFVPESIQYEVIMGSFAYGCSSDNSDTDIYSFCIPDKKVVFPHLNGEIDGFGSQKKRFEQWQTSETSQIIDPDKGISYDINVYNIVKYFHLAMGCNPNLLDSLYVPIRCITEMTPIGEHVRANRKIFLSKKAWHTFKGYAYAQLSDIKKKKGSQTEGKRKDSIDKYGFDVKAAYHIVRLINEVEQILTEGDIDLERGNDVLKAIRNGEWLFDDIESFFKRKEADLDKVYFESSLPKYPQEDKIKTLLLECLEMHFGNISSCVEIVDPAIKALERIQEVLNDYRQA